MKPANPIQVVGIKDLDEMELEAVYRIGDRYYGKLQRAVKNMASLVVHIKSYDKERIRLSLTTISEVITDWAITREIEK